MKNAYLISVHTDPLQLKRLINSLWDGYSFFILHVDKKVDICPFMNVMLKKWEDKIVFTKKRIWTQWAGFSQVKYQMILLDEMLTIRETFDRVFFLTGQDYPLWPLRQFEQDFEENPLREYIKGMNISECDTMKWKFTKYHFFRDLPVRSIRLKKIFSGGARILLSVLPFRKNRYVQVGNEKWIIYQSSACMALSYECAKYVAEKIRCEDLISYFKYTFAPDEMVIPTIIFNSKFRKNAFIYESNIYRGNKHFAITHEYVYEGFCKVYSENDYDVLYASKKMFARKFVSSISALLQDKIDFCRNSGTCGK